MKTIYEFRVVKKYAHLLFKKEECHEIGSDFICVVHLEDNDPRLKEFPKIINLVRRKNDSFFFSSWHMIHQYSKKELYASLLLHIKINRMFEPCGEEQGAIYDDRMACPICGDNRKQISSLILKYSSIPKTDISRTIADEVVVSERFVELYEKYHFTGASFKEINYLGRKKDRPIAYYQLIIPEAVIELSDKTIRGCDPFNLSDRSENEIYRCPNGHTVGLNLLSEVHIKPTEGNQYHDLNATRQKFGVRRGLLNPYSLLICSNRFMRVFKEERLKGLTFDRVYIGQ